MEDADVPTGTKKKRVLFVCGHNAGRSIAAEAIARKNRLDIQVASAGTAPSGKVNQAVLDALQAAGVPTEDLRSKSLEDDEVTPLDSWDMVITMGCMQMQCGTDGALKAKLSAQTKLEDWGLPDPAKDPAVIPFIIESIQQRVATL
ncbi:hypothetical protein CBR_g53941 [Chara braunii]|uniref:Phosphotyrosine protein phosphatase I domain-containing protein n=1 Tax=Chara braunii TaxID=69332 RepID=A0A388MBJ7_CHABU|nr:hypothetical protein CBR_g53941 [Chara braunii]|eukprot:GBG91883.1 hypothetical protein CBR_g53941 [Chara braunii]